jgi:hypothetical protein
MKSGPLVFVIEKSKTLAMDCTDSNGEKIREEGECVLL